jgi:tetratricopeptide (TPR) repeat protein
MISFLSTGDQAPAHLWDNGGMKRSGRRVFSAALVLMFLAAMPPQQARSAPATSCLDLRGLLPSSADFPQGWSVARVGAEEDGTRSGAARSNPSQGVSLVLDAMRQRAFVPLAEESLEITTPGGTFQVVYALLPPAPERTLLEAREALRGVVTGTGTAGRMFGRVLIVAATRDQQDLRALSDLLHARMTAQIMDKHDSAQAEGDTTGRAACLEDYLAAFPRNAPVHLALAEILLERGQDLPSAAAHLRSALDPSSEEPLSGSARWSALVSLGEVQQLTGDTLASRDTLRTALATATRGEERAAAAYQLAATEAILGHRDEALAALRQSFEANRRLDRPSGAGKAARDSAFAGLATDPAFKKLLEEFPP